MRVLVTGGSGFIASHLIPELLAAEHGVESLDVRPASVAHEGVLHHQLDFCEHRLLCERFADSRPEVVVHLGAIPSIQESIHDAWTSMTSNVTGTQSVLEASRRAGVSRVVFASSAAVYGRTSFERDGEALSEDLPSQPLNPYALAKKIGEDMLRVWASRDLWQAVDGVALRFFNVYGPRQRKDSAYATCIERFLSQWRQGDPFTIVPDGHQRRDMVFVGDVVRAIRLAVESSEPFAGEVLNVGGGRNYSVLEMAGVIGGADYPRMLIDPRSGEVRASLACIDRARERLGWAPQVAFPDGIARLKVATGES
jgi:UDP-glucose 4-epimerase